MKSIFSYFSQLFLFHMQGTDTIVGMILKYQRTGRIIFGTDSFQEMQKLRLLKLDGVHLMGDYGLISKQLRSVDWQ